jgi:uncharacterized protein HemX
MSDAVLTALIMTAGSVLCQILINRSNRKKRVSEDEDKEKARAVEEAVKAERLENRLVSIEGKLDTHNGYAEKLNNIERDMAVIKTDIKNLYKRGLNVV